MKSLMRKIDRFCILHPRFGISNLMLYIVIGNAAVWLFCMMDPTDRLISLLVFDAEAVFTRVEIWRLITFILVPQSTGFLYPIALYFYYFIGSTLERQWGQGKFTIYYAVGMLLNIIYGMVVWLITGFSIPITAGYLNLSMFFAFATFFPEQVVLLFFILPIKMKWLAIIDAVYFAASIGRMLFDGWGLASFLPLVAILNYLLFCGGWIFDRFRPARVKQVKKTVNFKKAAKEYNRRQAQRPYTRKCEVCGRTDTDYPDLEFRFCSKCSGYHCFCIDHINSHVHFKD